MGRTVVFFLGSGCSYPSGQPSVGELTDEVLTGQFYLIEALDAHSSFLYRVEDDYPRWGKRHELGDEAVGRTRANLSAWRRPATSIQKFLGHVAALPSWRGQPTYEDLAGLLNLIAASEYRTINDPLVTEYCAQNQIADHLAALEFPATHRFHTWPMSRKIVAVEDFVGWVVATCIRVKPRLNGYDSFAETIDDMVRLGNTVHVVTTNYDCNIERVFRKHGVRYHDGFSGSHDADDRGRRWRLAAALTFFSCQLPALIKLHGSTNWYRCQDANGSGASVLAACPVDLAPGTAHQAYIGHPSGLTFTPKGSPATLRGVLSKAGEYSYAPYSSLLAAFEHCLSIADVVVVSGFGWADEALNARLLRFVTSPRKRLLELDGGKGQSVLRRVKDLDERLITEVQGNGPILLKRTHMCQLAQGELTALITQAFAR